MTSTSRDVVAPRIGEAVVRWLETLDQGQHRRATFPFDSEEQFVWAFVPGERRGLPLGAMTATQRGAALAIVDATLSDRAAAEVKAIMALEPILAGIEREEGDDMWRRRDPDRYWFAVFGEPADRSPWSWRLEGHHVSVHWTIDDGQVVGTAPSFLGANPATVPGGPLAGERALDGEETLARALLAGLSPAQRRVAIVDPMAPPDILSGTGRRADVREVPIGIGWDQLEAAQRDGLVRLIRHYLDRSAEEMAAADWETIRAADLATVTFAWAGPDAPGHGHYYAIRGPNLLIEYDNTQDGANHIHSVRRDLLNDWGEDLLAAHYAAHHGADGGGAEPYRGTDGTGGLL